MKAVRIHSYGGSEVLRSEEAPKPQPGPGEALVRVHAAGVNPVDWKACLGRFRQFPLPFIPGWDVSGVVEALGPDTSGLAVGDEVFGLIRFPEPGNAYAELTTAPVEHLARKPKTIDHVQAAGLPLAALTALQAFEKAQLRAGQSVLVLGAAGGVGHLAVQLAKARGARVAGTSSGRNVEFVRGYGLDQFIDYTTTPVESAIRNVDVVLDTVGGDARDRALGTLRKGGTLVSIVGPPVAPERAAAAGVTACNLLVQPSHAQLEELARLVDGGRLKVYVETVLPLADARTAHERSQTGRVRGKLVLRVIH